MRTHAHDPQEGYALWKLDGENVSGGEARACSFRRPHASPKRLRTDQLCSGFLEHRGRLGSSFGFALPHLESAPRSSRPAPDRECRGRGGRALTGPLQTRPVRFRRIPRDTRGMLQRSVEWPHHPRRRLRAVDDSDRGRRTRHRPRRGRFPTHPSVAPSPFRWGAPVLVLRRREGGRATRAPS